MDAQPSSKLINLLDRVIKRIYNYTMNTQEPTIKQQIRARLEHFGITESVYIEKEVEEIILNALNADDVERVYLDEEGGLVIEST
jgi:hypothetical protein